MPIRKPKPQTKTATVIALLNRAKGATVDEICKVTGWQPHSARAFLSGLRKKAFAISREQRGDEDTAYRITQMPDHKAEKAAS